MEFHEASYLWVGLDFFGGFRGPLPGGMVSRWFSFSSSPWISSVLGRVASLLVADEALLVSDMFCPIARGEIDFVYFHSIGICLRILASRQNVTVSSSSEFPESYYIPVELPGFVQPLFPFPSSLSIREGGSSHHDSKLLGYSSLEGIH